MKSFATLFALTYAALSAAAPIEFQRRAIDPALVPEFGLAAGINPTGTGDCDGITNAAGNVVKIPCFCPPNRADFIASLEANVAAGRVVNNPGVSVSFPTGNSKDEKLQRMQAALVTLQNLRGPGVGCPAASTTFLAQQKAIQDGTDGGPAPAPPAQQNPGPAPAPAPAPSNGGVDPALVPEFGHQAGLNPTGTGDCDGIRNAAGNIVKIPCACPPDRSAFIQSLSANVAAGKVVNNPGISVSFPTDNSKASKLARMQTALVTLQNLRGPGVGCPAASTTFLAQQKAIQDGADTAPAPAPAPANPAPVPNAPATPAAGGVDPALVPDFGHQAGLNPTGTGDCDGAVKNAAGQTVKIPCSCPPDRDTFLASLNANVAAGRAVNNPGVAISFPTDNSNQSKAARINAVLITLQNLKGPGVGCPAASTTLLSQLKALQS